MTAPTPELTPAYLRDLARIVDGDMHDHQMTRLATRNALSAAADELEWLRIQRDNSDRRATACVEAMQSCDTENSRLRAHIEGAPHDHFGCGLVRAQQRTDHCNCWKADALG